MLEGLIFMLVAGVVIWLYFKVRYHGYMLLEEGQMWGCPSCMKRNEAHIFKRERCGTRRPKNLTEVYDQEGRRVV